MKEVLKKQKIYKDVFEFLPNLKNLIFCNEITSFKLVKALYLHFSIVLAYHCKTKKMHVVLNTKPTRRVFKFNVFRH
jgi:hypothetical protein